MTGEGISEDSCIIALGNKLEDGANLNIEKIGDPPHDSHGETFLWVTREMLCREEKNCALANQSTVLANRELGRHSRIEFV